MVNFDSTDNSGIGGKSMSADCSTVTIHESYVSSFDEVATNSDSQSCSTTISVSYSIFTFNNVHVRLYSPFQLNKFQMHFDYINTHFHFNWSKFQ